MKTMTEWAWKMILLWSCSALPSSSAVRKTPSVCPSCMTSIHGNTAGLLGGEPQTQVRCCQEMYLLMEAGFYLVKVDVLSQEGLPTLMSSPYLPSKHIQTLPTSAHAPLVYSVQEETIFSHQSPTDPQSKVPGVLSMYVQAETLDPTFALQELNLLACLFWHPKWDKLHSGWLGS